MDKKKNNKGVPVYTQEQMDSMFRAGLFLTFTGMVFSFCLGYVIGHVDLSRIIDFFR